MTNKFSGKYYKFILNDSFSFAIIIANSNEGKSIQLITNEGSYSILDVEQVKLIDGKKFEFEINQSDLIFRGTITLGKLNPLKKKVMGPFTYIPFMECKHSIYSMYHDISGTIIYNGIKYDFLNGIGYIEGDSGKNFPKKYIWYNSVLPNNKALTLAIASIPFGLFSFIGVLCFIKILDKEYYFCTWNRVKIEKIEDMKIVLKKGKYKLFIDITDSLGYDLAAPIKGSMNRYIKENIAVKSKYKLYYDNEIILDEEDKLSSCEWMW